MKAGKLQTHGSTNIIAKLEFSNFNCDDGDGILLITDGREASSITMGLQRGAKLPTPDSEYLKGCTMTMYGIGSQDRGNKLNYQQVKNIRTAWQQYLTTAGATVALVTP